MERKETKERNCVLKEKIKELRKEASYAYGSPEGHMHPTQKLRDCDLQERPDKMYGLDELRTIEGIQIPGPRGVGRWIRPGRDH